MNTKGKSGALFDAAMPQHSPGHCFPELVLGLDFGRVFFDGDG